MRRILLTMLLGTLLLPGHAPAQEAAWPTRPIRMVVPFAPGGSADRLLANIHARLTRWWPELELSGGDGAQSLLWDSSGDKE